MKALLIALILLFVCAGCSTVKTQGPVQDNTEAYSSKSMIDPFAVSMEWDQTVVVSMAGMPVIFYRNPDESADVRCAALAVINGLCYAYCYLYNDHAYLYWFDETINDYSLLDCDQEQWRQNFKLYCIQSDWQES